MEIMPILSAMRRSKVGAVLIGLQIALTLAIVSNALFIINERSQRMVRPSGIDEANFISLTNQWVGEPADIEARVRADLIALRSMPDVQGAAATNSFPLRGGGWSTSLTLEPKDEFDLNAARTSQYFMDEGGRDAWGLNLVEGRWFEASEVSPMHTGDRPEAKVAIITKKLAGQLFGAESAINRVVYSQRDGYTIIGVVERLQTPWAASGFGEPFVENSMLLPVQYLPSTGIYYTVRSKPGRQAAVLREVRETLLRESRARVLTDEQTFAETRVKRYRGDSALTKILLATCALLLVVTACGIVGLTTYWIAQRRRQIGVRRALGATRQDILRYFHVENGLIAVPGALLGIAAALALNAWTVSTFEMQRLNAGFLVVGAFAVVVIGQLAVLWPALRAAAIPPATATRAV